MKYPILLVKGDAFTPKRFWHYVTVFDDTQYNDLIEKGFVVSNQPILINDFSDKNKEIYQWKITR